LLVLLGIGLLVGRVLGRYGRISAGRGAPRIRLGGRGNRPRGRGVRPLQLGRGRHGSGLPGPGLLLGRIFRIRFRDIGGRQCVFQSFSAVSQHDRSTPTPIGDKDL